MKRNEGMKNERRMTAMVMESDAETKGDKEMEENEEVMWLEMKEKCEM